MDVVTTVRSCLSTWSKGGESECRNILIAPHCNPTDPNCIDVLTTAYQTLLYATLTPWAPKPALTPRIFVAFVQSVLDGLPSSSSPSSTNTSHAAIFGELLVDMIWALDAELEEVMSDAKAAITSCGDQAAAAKDIKDPSTKDRSVAFNKAVKSKQNAEHDKETVTVIVKKLLDAKILNPAFCRERLDLTVLASVGLVSDKAYFDKKEIRTRTGLFYKQNKFNLLREQSEGYSKLTAELTSNLGPPHSPVTGRPTEPWSAIEERARPVWDKVISLIGYFDLDPNRALDMILDVLSVNLATHYSFFIALLSLSPWCGSYKRPTTEENIAVDSEPGLYKGKTLDEVLQLADSKPRNTASAGISARVLAQVLGFKFAYYQSPDVSEVTPKSLYLTAAILIREGFITLEDLYPHITPNDENMDKVKKDYMANVQSRIAGAKTSQLAMAAPLESTPSSSHSRPTKATPPAESKKTAEVKEPPPQKIGLLTALLSVGALRPAIAIMSKFPWVADAQPEIADLMIRIMKHSLSALYESAFVTKERNPSFTQPRARYGAGGVAPPPPRKPHLTLWAPTPPSTNAFDFVFFFPDWTERVPICSSLDDLVDVIEPLMRFIGLHISRDPTFLTKFLRLGRSHLQSTVPINPETKKPSGEPDPEDPIRRFWFKILRMYLLPALSLIRGNAVCTVEVWNIIRQYETTARWRLYGEWKSTIYKSHPELRIREVQADRESKGILRRLSHNTIDTLSGTVAKLAHSNPCIFFANAVNQIMAYDNLANVVIQGLRYVTNMGFDVLVFIILDALANPKKERLKDDGVNTSDWLQSLASFTGMLFRRYSADLTPVLKYIVHQLHNGQTTEIVVLRELIWKMAGIEPLPSLSDSQIAAMAGGPVLRIESVASTTRGARLDPGDAVLKGPQRLGKGLVDSGLALPLLIQVAQQRQSCVFTAQDAHLKSLAGLYDTTHGVLLQYLELLTSPAVISANDYATKIIPSLADLGELYGISAPICMQIIRPVLHSSLLAAALSMQEQERVANEEAEKRLKAALTAKREPSTTASRVASPSLNTPGDSSTDMKVDTKVVPKEGSISEDVQMEVETTVLAPPPPENPWLPELSALFDDIKKIAPGNAFDVIGPGFYVTFWQLSTYDLSPPAARYDEEGAALRMLSRQEDSKYIAADRSADRAKRQTAVSHRTRRDRYNAFVNTLAQEFKEQTVSRAFTMKRMAREKQHWFAHTPNGKTLASAIIEHCLQPRCLLSPMDADFCSQIIKVIHAQGTPGFPTLLVYDKLLADHVKVVVFSCSEYEARNYGRFLSGILTDLYKWHQDEQLYLQDNRTKSGGKTAYHPGFQRNWSYTRTVTADGIMKWSEYRLLLKKWYRKLAKGFVDCIETGEFMHVYNTIVVLKEILPVFPLSTVHDPSGPYLNGAMDRFLETEERGDLKILGRAYSASLKKREALWAPNPNQPNGTPAPTKPANHSTGEKTRNNVAPPNGPSSQTVPTGDGRRTVAPPASSTPSAPRAQLANNTTSEKPSIINSTKLSMESIPRPEVVKRIRPETKTGESPKPNPDSRPPAPSDSASTTTDRVPSSVSHMSEIRTGLQDGTSTPTRSTQKPPISRVNSPAITVDTSATAPRPQPSNLSSTPHTTIGKEPPQSPRNHRPADEKARVDPHPVMPPPSVPSQTLSAQELRETAKQSINRPSDKVVDDKLPRPAPNDTRNQNGSTSAAPSPTPRRRTPSPSSRPGTRNPSADSRTSGGRTRSNGSDEKRSERETRQESRDHASNVGRRDSLTHNRSDRNARSRTSTREDEKDSERDRDTRGAGRDRHGDRDRDKERDRERDRDREREREREQRDRERDRDRDRHRRDDKDRDRDSRKERDSTRAPVTSAVPGATSAPAADERALPTRPDPSRHRPPPNGEDGLGKRRRGLDDDPERSSKRSSRKDGHRDDRSRRPSEKEAHDTRPSRESDRRRKERDSVDDGRGSVGGPPDKAGEKRIPDGPSSASKILPPNIPLAPRAMSSSEISRAVKTEAPRDRDRDRDRRDRDGERDRRDQTPSAPSSHQDGGGSHGLGSLRSRIGEKEPPPSRSTLPQAPPNSYRPGLDTSRKDEDRDGGSNSRKRTISDREKETLADAAALGSPSDPSMMQPPKRPRIIRNRYTSQNNPHALVKKLLPIDPQAGDKTSARGRKD